MQALLIDNKRLKENNASLLAKMRALAARSDASESHRGVCEKTRLHIFNTGTVVK
jgi:hypothetical protein